MKEIKHGSDPVHETEANAGLIAHASELLEALRRCVNLMGHPFVGQPSDADLPAWNEWRSKARSIIAKVEEER